jgi:hypothetical protein
MEQVKMERHTDRRCDCDFCWPEKESPFWVENHQVEQTKEDENVTEVNLESN